jgi:hypothetical protein
MNTRTFSNQAEVGAWLINSVADFGFNSPGPSGKKLGDAIVDNHVQQIKERSYGEQRGAGADWPKNDPEYTERKARDGLSTLVNVATGQMLDDESLRGQVQIGDRELVHVYGTGRPGEPKEPKAPKKPRKKPRKTRPEPTDIAKAGWAAEKGRGFFELDEQIKERNADLVGDALADHLRSR